MIIIKNHQNNVGNYSVPYMKYLYTGSALQPSHPRIHKLAALLGHVAQGRESCYCNSTIPPLEP